MLSRPACFLFCVIVFAGLVDRSVAAAPCWRPPTAAPVVDPFREPACAWCAGNRGIEYDTVIGDTVRAVAAGEVTYAGAVAGVRYVVVRHAGGLRVTYGGLEMQRVRVGDRVVGGSVVGTAGGSVHFGVRTGDRYVDPAPFIGVLVQRARLVPVTGPIPPSTATPILHCTANPVSFWRREFDGVARVRAG